MSGCCCSSCLPVTQRRRGPGALGSGTDPVARQPRHLDAPGSRKEQCRRSKTRSPRDTPCTWRSRRRPLAGFTPPSERLAGVVVKGAASPRQLSQLRQRLEIPRRARPGARGARQVAAYPHELGDEEERGAAGVEPHRAAVDRTERRARPHCAGVAARLGAAARRIRWKPITLVGRRRGPTARRLPGGDCGSGQRWRRTWCCHLHERFQKNLLLGKPQARGWWKEIRRYIEFYSWNLPKSLSAARQHRRRHGRSDGVVRGDEPPGAPQPAVRDHRARNASQPPASPRSTC